MPDREDVNKDYVISTAQTVATSTLSYRWSTGGLHVLTTRQLNVKPSVPPCSVWEIKWYFKLIPDFRGRD